MEKAQSGVKDDERRVRFLLDELERFQVPMWTKRVGMERPETKSATLRLAEARERARGQRTVSGFACECEIATVVDFLMEECGAQEEINEIERLTWGADPYDGWPRECFVAANCAYARCKLAAGLYAQEGA